ncbi:MAG: DNA polymerase-3 subunit alpha [Pelagibacterales bacterium]|nr:DNA polymerase-3 subunit alpha [Pelagibacterales bacterium]
MNLDTDKDFTHLKVHTQYSICEGALKTADLANHCKLNKIKAVGLCDSNNMCGALEFSETVAKSKTQPIIGTQINIKYKNNIGKIPFFAQNLEGYKNLIKLSSKSFLDVKDGEEPHCTFEDLKDNSNGIILFTGTYEGLIGKLFFKNLTDEILELLKKIKNIFNNNFYIEIQRHGEEKEIIYEKYLLNISNKLELPIIATHEVFYLEKDMYEAHDAYLCVGEKTYVNVKDRRKYNDTHYLKNNEDMHALFKDIPEAIENNINFPLRISFRPKNSLPILPNIQTSSLKNVDDILIQESLSGLKEKLTQYVLPLVNKKDIKVVTEEYTNRLNHEISIISKMKYSSYFLIVSDYVKWAKNNSIPVGPGRGSGAGSLVAWVLSITDIDPIKFDLIFERFLNPDRISMPDFDIDFCEERRDQVFKYLKQKYGKGVAHIITFGKLKSRMAFRDIGRVLGIPYGYVDALCKMIPFDPSRPLSLKESIAREPRLQKEEKNDPRVKKLIELSLKLEGLNRNMATHAAGVVIPEENLSEFVPLYKDHSSNSLLPSTQFDMYASENAGLVKFDLLGLKTLTVISKTVSLLKEKKIELDISKIKLDDPKIYELLSTGHTVGLFQLESAGMRDALVNMKPNKFDDIIALVALYRPGPMSNIPTYNQCKHGEKEPDYLHPNLKKILEPTYGVIIYQEQVMQIAQTLSGFTPGEADILRKAMGKKKRAELEKQKQRFIDGAVSNGIRKDIAASIFLKIEPFAEYGFNKSHAAAYAMIAYQTAYLKTYHPNEFIAASMSNELSNVEKLSEFYEELKRLKINIQKPCVNECFAEFIPKGNKLFYALGAIKNVGFEAISQVVKEREKNGKFKSISDFINRIEPKNINKLQLEALVKAGAIDSIYPNRSILYENIPNIIQTSKNIFENKANNQSSLFSEDAHKISYLISNDKISKWTNDESLTKEFESVGFYISDHPLNGYNDVLEQHKVKTFRDFENSKDNECHIAGTVMSVKEKKTSKGTSFAIVKFSDLSKVFELFLFSEILDSNRSNLIPGKSFILTIIKDKDNQDNRFRRISVRKVVSLQDAINKTYNNVFIEIKTFDDLKKLYENIKEKGYSKIRISVDEKNKNYVFELKDKRKFDYVTLKNLNKEQYIKKITV